MGNTNHKQRTKRLFARLEERCIKPPLAFTYDLVRGTDSLWLKLRAHHDIIVLAGMQHAISDVPDISVVIRLTADETGAWPMPLHSNLVWVAVLSCNHTDPQTQHPEQDRLWRCHQILHSEELNVRELSEWELQWDQQLTLRFLELAEEGVFIPIDP